MGVLPTVVGPEQVLVMEQEVNTLLEKGAIEYVPPSNRETGFYSRSEDWFVTIDLKDAYFHISIRPCHWKFLRFAFGGKAYQYRVLPFGLALSPRTFTKCVDAALAPLRLQGIRIFNYIDDWLILAQSHQEAIRHRDVVLAHMKELGLRLNAKKSVLSPLQRTTFLGVVWDSVSMQARLSPPCVDSILAAVKSVKLGQLLTVKQFQRLLGLMAAASNGIPFGLLHMRPLQWWLRTRGFSPRGNPFRTIKVTRRCLRALVMWKKPWFLSQGPVLGAPCRRKLLTTDASLTGWGAILEGRSSQGLWEDHHRSWHINHLEMLAVFRALRSFITDLRADTLSRQGPRPGEWRLHPEAVELIWREFGQAQVDLFASRETSHGPLWFSLTHPAPLGLDAMVQTWPRLCLYAFPPVALLPGVLERVRRDRVCLLPIAPRWPGRVWFPDLVSLLDGHPLELPVRRDLLSQAGGSIFHPRPELWNLWAWPLRGPAHRVSDRRLDPVNCPIGTVLEFLQDRFTAGLPAVIVGISLGFTYSVKEPLGYRQEEFKTRGRVSRPQRVNDELLRLKVDIAALQETHLAVSGSLKEKDYTFFWQGKSAEDRRKHGVGFAVRNTLLEMVELGDKGSECLLTLRLHTFKGPVTLISAYAPTLTSTPEAKDEFYTNLNDAIKNIHSSENLVSLTKPQHRVSWCHPRSKHWHQLDMVIVRRTSLKYVLLARSYHSADCDSNHSLVCCKIKLLPKKLHRSKQEGKPRIDKTKMQHPEKLEEFTKSLEDALSVGYPYNTASASWNHLGEAIQISALATYGRNTFKDCNWFDVAEV
ncbi:unnamed protein product [Leuciscus chuanchicus]